MSSSPTKTGPAPKGRHDPMAVWGRRSVNAGRMAEIAAKVASPDLMVTTVTGKMLIATLKTATQSGWIGPGIAKNEKLGSRVSHDLLEAAMASSGITSKSALVEYALAKVALEDDFGQFLLSQEGTVDPDLDLEF